MFREPSYHTPPDEEVRGLGSTATGPRAGRAGKPFAALGGGCAALVLCLVFMLAACLLLGGCSPSTQSPGTSGSLATSASSAAASVDESDAASPSGTDSPNRQDGGSDVVESGEYSDKNSVALYVHRYGHLPSNYISKTKARKAGWVSSSGNLWDVLPGKSIGGSVFYDDDEQLPYKRGRTWIECDIDYEGGYRNAKRLVYSNDRLVFYTDDHYRTFEQLY